MRLLTRRRRVDLPQMRALTAQVASDLIRRQRWRRASVADLAPPEICGDMLRRAQIRPGMSWPDHAKGLSDHPGFDHQWKLKD